MRATLQAMIEPVDGIIHTDRKVQLERRHEVGIDKLIIAAKTPGKLGLSDHLQGIIPSSGSLQAQLSGIAQQIFRGFVLMQGIALGSLVTQAHFQLVFPLHLLLIVIISLHRDTTQHRVVALTTFIPVITHIILKELQVIIPLDRPEIRFRHIDFHR